MFHRNAVAGFAFEEGWRSNLDWSAWLSLSKRPGAFVYVATPLVNRTLHAGAATTQWLPDRAKEDARILRSIWPWPLGHLLSAAYRASLLPYSALRAPVRAARRRRSPGDDAGS